MNEDWHPADDETEWFWKIRTEDGSWADAPEYAVSLLPESRELMEVLGQPSPAPGNAAVNARLSAIQDRALRLVLDMHARLRAPVE
jgi:hypothetical protein